MMLLEHGTIDFLYRPRVEEYQPETLADVQRLLVLLSPEASPFERLIAIGRKHPFDRKRFWGFVDLVLAPYDMLMALGDQVYGTKTRGVRHLPAARIFATGAYDIVTHDEHSHLQWHVEPVAGEIEIELETKGNYIVTVANPDPTAWDIEEPPDLQFELFDELEVHVTIPTPFPASLQERFANNRFSRLDTVEWLDHPGAELVFIAAERAVPNRAP